MELLYHMFGHVWPYFVGRFPWNLGLKHRPNRYGRYLQSIGSWNGGVLSHRGTPSHHPNFERWDFPENKNQPANLGIPHGYGNPQMAGVTQRAGFRGASEASRRAGAPKCYGVEPRHRGPHLAEVPIPGGSAKQVKIEETTSWIGMNWI